jgi:hypothetical protein
VTGHEEPAADRPWAVRIGAAGRDELARLVAGHLDSFSEREVLLVLGHPYVTPEIVERIVRTRALLRVRSVRRALALHPATPRPDALRVLEDLPWRDLAAVSREVRTPAPVRQAANRRLLELLRRLSAGEKTALARIADRDLFQALLEENEPMVLEALCQNGRLTADDLVRWLTVGRASSASLERLAGTPRWSHRPAVREAILRHRLAPRPVVLGLLLSATRAEWLKLSADETLSPLLAAWARRLAESSGSFIDSGRKRVLT